MYIKNLIVKCFAINICIVTIKNVYLLDGVKNTPLIIEEQYVETF